MITGIIRVAKESIFSGLNNLNTESILSYSFSDKFGFTEEEVEALVVEYEANEQVDNIKSWYNGYYFGNTTIYNPWSILNYLAKPREGLKPHWVNTTSNDLVNVILSSGGDEVKKDLNDLINGKTITKYIDENVVMADIEVFQEIFSDYVLKSLSYFDISEKEGEKVYHAFVLGMLVSLNDEYEVLSNRESGYGRYDVCIIPKDSNKLGIILEFKKLALNSAKTMDMVAEEALLQIKDKKYAITLENRGITNILKLAIMFKGKEIFIKKC